MISFLSYKMKIAYERRVTMAKKLKQQMQTMSVSTLRPLPQQPRLNYLAKEVVSAEEVYHWGAGRVAGPPHAILQYTIRGEGRLDYLGKTHRLTPGTAFFVHNTDPEMVYYNLPKLKQEWEILWCSISPGKTLADEMISRHGPVYHLSPDSWFLGQLRHYLNSGKDFVQLRLDESILLVARLLMELVVAASEKREDHSSGKLIQAFCEYVHTHMSEPITVIQAAKYLKVSREYLTRTCKEEIQISPGTYINQTKIYEAMRLLRDPEYIVKEVCFEVGYQHASHFARVFSRLVGLSPLEFRNSSGHSIISPLFSDS
jgi:AraC-like DNA-binding protein